MVNENLFFNRDGNTIGPFTESDVDSMLARGQVRQTDMFLREGVHDWIQVGQSELNDRIVRQDLDPLGNPRTVETTHQLTVPQQWTQEQLTGKNNVRNAGTIATGRNIIDASQQATSKDLNDLKAELKGLKVGSVDDHLLATQIGASAMQVAMTYNNTMPGAISAGLGGMYVEEHSDRTDATLDVLNKTQRIMDRNKNKKLRRQVALEWLINEKGLFRNPMILWGRTLFALCLLAPVQIIGFGVGFVSILGLVVILLINSILLFWFMWSHKVKMTVIVKYPNASNHGLAKMLWRKKAYIPAVSVLIFFYYGIPCMHFIL